VNGSKKWITGGMIGDYFTTAVRTGDEGLVCFLKLGRNFIVTFREKHAWNKNSTNGNIV
jgi:alkylation response protein AidB-like acyl-CoA dehydrogenase